MTTPRRVSPRRSASSHDPRRPLARARHRPPRARSPSGTTRGRPRVEETTERVEVELGGRVVASTDRAWRVLETSHPPTYYLPREAFEADVLREAGGQTWCEFKGRASYFHLVSGDAVASERGLDLPAPSAGFEADRRRDRGDARRSWTAAPSTARSSSRSPAASTAAGSPVAWSVRSRASPAPWAGEPSAVVRLGARRAAGRRGSRTTARSPGRRCTGRRTRRGS